jgi:hypothetical protein
MPSREAVTNPDLRIPVFRCRAKESKRKRPVFALGLTVKQEERGSDA